MSERARKLAEEGLEIAEDELAYVKESGRTQQAINTLDNYKRQRALSQALLEALEENKKLEERLGRFRRFIEALGNLQDEEPGKP